MAIDVKKIEKATEEFFSGFKNEEGKEQETAPASPRDYYDEYGELYSQRRDSGHGARAKVAIDAEVVLNSLPALYKAAKHESDRLVAQGEKGYAKMVRDQYMNEKFMPAIEALIRTNSVDSVMNATTILDMLDKYALIDGGSAKGFTRSFVRSLYGTEVGDSEPFSDSQTRECVAELKRLAADGNIRAAIGKATKVLKKIDSGDQSANSDDYELIQKIALKGQ